ncbi:hypothetical protein SKAU_G00249490 [Synaphobranchus kaupii]|uniref:Uncharacterized protein n=1 Tax=Synaphobranchus kaupii TaxID=118154 RepID=A0A9Q1IPN3_SYNKA|nr:hypothetical protein SKAU_G00249490 [Synaphobranchus kaupii]
MELEEKKRIKVPPRPQAFVLCSFTKQIGSSHMRVGSQRSPKRADSFANNTPLLQIIHDFTITLRSWDKPSNYPLLMVQVSLITALH